MTSTDLDTTLRSIIAEVLEIEPEDLTETSDFADDHGADSLRTIEILARIEKRLAVRIPQEELSNMVNLSAVRSIVHVHAPGEAR